MNNTGEFVIENGVLLKYSGDGKTVVIPDGVKEIRNNTFIARRNLSSVTIPESVTKIGYNAFHSCEGLVSVSLPESVIEIGGAAFALCKNLININIPKNITKIDDATFASCESLESIIVPKGVLEIGDNAFDNCNNLTSITIPESVRKIGDNVFIGSDKVVICAPTGSYAEQYAKENNIRLKSEFASKQIKEENNAVDKQESVSKQYQDENFNSSKQEGCYIATAVYGDYNDPNVMVLRSFRDNYLSKRNWGVKFIKSYYRYSPRLADKLKNHIVINAIIRKILDLLVKKLRKNQ